MTMRRQSASGLSRRSFLSSSARALGGIALGAGGARTVWGQTAAPAVITSDRMRPGTPSGVQSGDVSADRAVIWSRTDRPARLIVEYATTASFANLQRVMGPAALPESDFSARVDLAGLPPGQDIFYRVIFQDLADPKILSAPALGRFRTPPAGRRTITFVWSGGRGRPGLGHQSRLGRHEALRGDASGEPGLLHSFGRPDLCGRADPGRGEARGRDPVEERHHAREVEGGGDAGRVPRQLRLQPARRPQASLLCRGAVPRPVGRSRGAEQLVSGPDAGRRALPAAQRLAAGRLRAARDVRVQRDAHRPRRSRAHLPLARLRALARRLHAGRAELPRAQLAEPADRAGRRGGIPGNRAASVVEARAPGLARDLEGDRKRYAHQPGGARPQPRRAEGDVRGRGPTATTASRPGGSSSWRACCRSSRTMRSRTWCG